MEKTKKKTRTIKSYEHPFYCDSCDKYLGTVEEHEDGWYPDLGEFKLNFYVKDDWYRINKCFCDECKNNFVNKVKSTLENLGFERD